MYNSMLIYQRVFEFAKEGKNIDSLVEIVENLFKEIKERDDLINTLLNICEKLTDD